MRDIGYMAVEIVSHNMPKALKEIDRLVAVIEWRCIRTIHEPLKTEFRNSEARSTLCIRLSRSK